MVKKPWTETAITVAMNVAALGGDRWLIWMAGGVFCLNIVLWTEWWGRAHPRGVKEDGNV